jgi:hypothetical protein
MRSPSDKYNCCGCFVVCKIEKNNAKQNFSDLPQFGVIVKGGFANVQVG